MTTRHPSASPTRIRFGSRPVIAAGFVKRQGQDELFEAVTLVQTRKVSSFPIVLVGRDFWSGLVDWIDSAMLAEGMIGPDDPKLLTVVDTAEEAVAAVLNGIHRLAEEIRWAESVE